MNNSELFEKARRYYDVVVKLVDNQVEQSMPEHRPFLWFAMGYQAGVTEAEQQQLVGRISQMLYQFQVDGKLLVLSDEQLQAIDKHIRDGLAEFHAEMRRKQAQSIDDTRKIILDKQDCHQ